MAEQRAVLSARSLAGGELLLVSLDVDEEIARAYTTPGQYIEVKAESGNGYFVLASDVGQRPWQLLVKNAGGAADALATSPLGTSFTVVGPLGAGFSVERMRSRHVVVAVVGSALGVARSVARATHRRRSGHSHPPLPRAPRADGPRASRRRSRIGQRRASRSCCACRAASSSITRRSSPGRSASRAMSSTPSLVRSKPGRYRTERSSLPPGPRPCSPTCAPWRPAPSSAAGPSVEVLTNV